MRRSTIIAEAALALCALLVPGWAQAQEQEPAPAPGEIRFYDENDSWLNPLPSRTDRYYTQGLRLEWLQPEDKSDAHFLPGISHSDWCRLICGSDSGKGSVNTGYAFGQNIYTPADTGFADPQPNDRPWAGWLYVSRIARSSYVSESLKAQRQDRIEVSLGIVGPASLAKEAQSEFHGLVGADRPRGWHNQLRNEPVLQLRYETALRWPKREGGHADVIPRVRANVGNALTSLEAEVTGRIGWNLSGFGVQALPAAFMAEALPPAGPGDGPKRRKWLASGNLFLRAGIKAVAHNITLDGNSFRNDDILIRRKPFVPEIGIGFELNVAGNFWLGYQFIHRGSEFERRNGRDAPAHEFGSISLALKLDK
jgi:hypothetical protein